MSKDFDMQRVSMALAVLCLIGLGVTVYALYSAEISQGSTFVWTSLIVSSLLGGTSIVLALRQTKEIIVFKERDKSQDVTLGSSTGNQGDGNIDLSQITKIAQQGGKEAILSGLKVVCSQLEAGQGAFYEVKDEGGARWVELAGGYALSIGESNTIKFDLGEGLIGQSAAEGRSLYIDEVPEGYMKIASGLGMASPRYLFITPVKKDKTVSGVLEVSTFKPMTEQQKKFVEEAAQLLGSKA